GGREVSQPARAEPREGRGADRRGDREGQPPPPHRPRHLVRRQAGPPDARPLRPPHRRRRPLRRQPPTPRREEALLKPARRPDGVRPRRLWAGEPLTGEGSATSCSAGGLTEQLSREMA